MKNVVAYIRVSTDGQLGEDKFGLDAQREQIQEYCDNNGLNIVKWYSDEGESGAKYRPGFDEIVYGEVTNPPYEAVVVAKSDRVARDINIYFYYQGALLRKGVELISICEDFGQFGAFANMLKAFTLTCAEMERENITKRTMSGRAVKAARGGYSGGTPPYGYKAQDKKLVVIPEEAEVVRKIFKWRQEKLTLANIAFELNREGKLTRRGKTFNTSTVQYILGNEDTYRGKYKYGTCDAVEGQHEAILPEK